MANASWALQKSIHDKLSTDTTITSLLGGQRVFDDVPRGATFPYITFGHSTARDWDTGSDSGDEHILTLHVWSRGPGRREAQNIVGAMKAALHDQTINLLGHRLINLRQEFADARRDPDGETFHGIVRLRAVTEPIG